MDLTPSDKMLAVENLILELPPLCHSAYRESSSLLLDKEVIQSSEGIQQGDIPSFVHESEI